MNNIWNIDIVLYERSQGKRVKFTCKICNMGWSGVLSSDQSMWDIPRAYNVRECSQNAVSVKLREYI